MVVTAAKQEEPVRPLEGPTRRQCRIVWTMRGAQMPSFLEKTNIPGLLKSDNHPPPCRQPLIENCIIMIDLNSYDGSIIVAWFPFGKKQNNKNNNNKQRHMED